MISSRWGGVAVCLALSICTSVSSAQTGAGVAHFMRTSDPSFDVYTNNPSLTTQQWLQQHFWRMLVYSPYFDTRLSWYPNGFVYIDSYAIYTGSALATQHPEWILKDSSRSEEHTSELQSLAYLVCRLLLE